MKELQIIIPVRAGGNAYTTLRSLGKSEYQDCDIVISQDEWGNANKARNAGYALAQDSELVLFSDDDIEWECSGIGAMVNGLRYYPDRAFCYGAYQMGERFYCRDEFDAALLQKRNYISTMTVIRRQAFPGWDESLERLQDWALFLQMVRNGHSGVHYSGTVFKTAVRDGITRNGKVSYQEAEQVIRRKHGI